MIVIMGISKKVAYYDPIMDPHPFSNDLDGMWITREEPFEVVKVWRIDERRPSVAEEPSYIQAYSIYMAQELYEFRKK